MIRIWRALTASLVGKYGSLIHMPARRRNERRLRRLAGVFTIVAIRLKLAMIFCGACRYVFLIINVIIVQYNIHIFPYFLQIYSKTLILFYLIQIQYLVRIYLSCRFYFDLFKLFRSFIKKTLFWSG